MTQRLDRAAPAGRWLPADLGHVRHVEAADDEHRRRACGAPSVNGSSVCRCAHQPKTTSAAAPPAQRAGCAGAVAVERHHVVALGQQPAVELDEARRPRGDEQDAGHALTAPR
jgi:hypothetical protein